MDKVFDLTIDDFYFIDKAHFAIILRIDSSSSVAQIVHGPTQKIVVSQTIQVGQRRKQFIKACVGKGVVWLQNATGVIQKADIIESTGKGEGDVYRNQSGAEQTTESRDNHSPQVAREYLANVTDIVDETLVSKFEIYGDFVYVISDSIRNKQNKSVSRLRVFNAISGVQLGKKDFKGVQEINVKASPDGTFALIMASSYVDRQNQSYYGKENMYVFLGDPNNKEACKVNLMDTYQGNIHDWNILPRQGIAVIISGKMPCRTVIYDFKGLPTYLLEHDFKNVVSFSPNHTILALAGFGQCSGEIKVFSLKNNNLIGKSQCSFSSFLKWSPNGKQFLTATVLKKLNENHRYSVFDYKGAKLAQHKVPENDLVNVDFFFKAKIAKQLDLTDFVAVKKGRNPTGLLSGNRDEPGKIGTSNIANYNSKMAPIVTPNVFNKPNSCISFGAPKLSRKKA